MVSLSTQGYGSVLVELSSVAFRYGRRDPWVLQEVTLTVPRGRIVEVTGPNGAGKSTLLRLIAGILRPRRGTITGRPVRVGFAPERFQPFPVSTYLRHVAAMRRIADAEVAIAQWSGQLGFGHLLGVPLPQLSKGSAHKVGLAQALLASPVKPWSSPGLVVTGPRRQRARSPTNGRHCARSPKGWSPKGWSSRWWSSSGLEGEPAAVQGTAAQVGRPGVEVDGARVPPAPSQPLVGVDLEEQPLILAQ
ncbi:MAG: transporter related protein [Streptosporangiaceae bacterium]|nr:transporter related protein [Streptosporangiaceae bacterium]